MFRSRNFMHNESCRLLNQNQTYSKRHRNQISNPVQQQPYREEKEYLSDGRLKKVSIFKDVNRDGKEDLYSVTFYDYEVEVKDVKLPRLKDLKNPLDNKNGAGEDYFTYKELKSTRTFTDFDADGYNDYFKKVEYDKLGNIISETGKREENIQSVKNKHGENFYGVLNRRMSSHYKGTYVY